MMRAGLYVRLSKEDGGQAESESIQNQKNMLSDYAKKQGWEIYRIYSDDDYSGASTDRPEFQQLLKDAEEGKLNIILCKSQSRFSRDISVIEEYLHTKFPLWGVRFVSLIDNADTEQKSNKKARQINSLVNEWFLEDLSENIRAVFKTKMRRGEYLAAFAPYGYKKDENKKNHLVPDENTREAVKLIFTRHIEGCGAVKIARELNSKAIPTPSLYRQQNSLPSNGKVTPLWSASTVSAILKNPVYYGHTVQNVTNRIGYKSSKKIRLNKSEWIIAENTHEPLSQGLKFTPPVRKKSTACEKSSILSGKVFCGSCGFCMQRVNTKTAKGKKITYLRCKKRYLTGDDDKCSTPSVRLDDLETETFKKAKEIIHKHKTEGEIKNLLSTASCPTSEKNDRSEEIKKLDLALESLYIDKASGIISAEEYVRFSESFNKKRAELTCSRKHIHEEEKKDTEKLYDDFLKLFTGHALEKIVISKNENNEPCARFYWKGISQA